MVDHNDIALDYVLSEEELKQKKRNKVEEVLFWIGLLINLGTMNFGVGLTRFLVPSAAIPLEITKIGLDLKAAKDTKKSALAITGIFFFGALSLFFLSVMSALKWGAKAGIVVGTSSVMPFIGTAVLGLVGIVLTASFAKSLYNHKKAPELTTPLAKVNLVTSAIYAASFLALAAMVAGMIFFPPLASIFVGIAVVAFATILVTKIAKTIKENHVWKKSTEEMIDMNKSTYVLLGTTKHKIDELLQNQLNDKKDKNIFQRARDEISKVWKSFFGTPKEKQEIKDGDPDLFLRGKYEEALNAALPADKLRIQKAYDLIGTPRGRMKYYDYAIKIKEEKKIDDYIEKNIPVREQEPVGDVSSFAQMFIEPVYRREQGHFGNSRKNDDAKRMDDPTVPALAKANFSSH